MQDALLQKLFAEASTGPCPWLAQVVKATGADEAQAHRVQKVLNLFAELGPVVEQDACARADARLRDYAGTPFASEQRSTLEAIYVAAGYSKLALALAVLHAAQPADGGSLNFDI